MSAVGADCVTLIETINSSRLWAGKTDIPYTVKHYKQSLDGTYVLEQTEEKTGATGQSTAAEAKTYTGFTVQDFTQKTIEANGSTVVEIYYERNYYIVNFNGNGSDDGFMGDQVFMYGEIGDLIANMYTRTDSNFIGWNTKEDGSGQSYTDGAMVKNLTDEADGIVILYAQWSGEDDTKYDLWIDGRRVTSTNAHDVFDDGKVSYDADTKTLTLSGANRKYDIMIPASSYSTGTIYAESDQ